MKVKAVKNIGLIIMILFSLLACQSQEEMTSNESSKDSSPTSRNGNATLGDIRDISKVIRTATLHGEVDDIDKSYDLLSKKLEAFPGFIAAEEKRSSGFGMHGSLVIKVENDSFEKLLNDLESVFDKTIERRVKTRDVSAEHIDLMTRLRTKRKVMLRYEEFLKKAENIKEILIVEEQLRIVQEEIESGEARLRYMDDQIQWSTINMSLKQASTLSAKAGWNIFLDIKFAFFQGWKSFTMAIVFLTGFWPWLLMLGGFYFICRRKKWFQKGILTS